MADIQKYTDSHLSSNETEACAILMALIIAHKYKFTFNIEIRTDNMQCVSKIKKWEIQKELKKFKIILKNFQKNGKEMMKTQKRINLTFTKKIKKLT